MKIIELNHKPEVKIKDAIVELDYDEIRDVVNGLYRVIEKEKVTQDKSMNKTYRKFIILFDLVKHGMVTQFTIDHCATKNEGEIGESEVAENG